MTAFHYLKGSYKADKNSVFTRSLMEIRGNGYMLHQMFHLDIRKKNTVRTINQ